MIWRVMMHRAREVAVRRMTVKKAILNRRLADRNLCDMSRSRALKKPESAWRYDAALRARECPASPVATSNSRPDARFHDVRDSHTPCIGTKARYFDPRAPRSSSGRTRTGLPGRVSLTILHGQTGHQRFTVAPSPSMMFWYFSWIIFRSNSQNRSSMDACSSVLK